LDVKIFKDIIAVLATSRFSSVVLSTALATNVVTSIVVANFLFSVFPKTFLVPGILLGIYYNPMNRFTSQETVVNIIT
jgi:hypothetical protein